MSRRISFFTWVDELIRHRSARCGGIDSWSQLLAWNTHWFIKERAMGASRLHQDLTYWHLESDEAITAWIALSLATVEAARCEWYRARTGARVVAHTDTWKQGAMLTRGQEIAVDVDEASAIDVELAAGENVAASPQIFHASPANRAQDGESVWRCVIIPTHVRQVAINRRQRCAGAGRRRLQPFSTRAAPDAGHGPGFYHLREHAAERQKEFSITAPAARNCAPIFSRVDAATAAGPTSVSRSTELARLANMTIRCRRS